MKNYFPKLLIISSMLLLLFACNDGEENSQAHQDVVTVSNSIQELHSKANEYVLNITKIKEKLVDTLERNPQVDTSFNNLIMEVNATLIDCERLTKKHETLISQHKKYIDQHENTAMAADQIKKQHDQINEDYFTISKDVLLIEEHMFDVQKKASKLIDLDETLVFFHGK